MLEDDFYTVNNHLCKTDMPLMVLDAWNRIKKMRKELAQQIHNKPSMPFCPKCGWQIQVSERGYDCTNLSCSYGGTGEPTHIG